MGCTAQKRNNRRSPCLPTGDIVRSRILMRVTYHYLSTMTSSVSATKVADGGVPENTLLHPIPIDAGCAQLRMHGVQSSRTSITPEALAAMPPLSDQ